MELRERQEGEKQDLLVRKVLENFANYRGTQHIIRILEF